MKPLDCPIGLGMAALGRPGYITLGHSDDLSSGTSVGAMEAHAHSILDAAWNSGVRYFDVARSYGRAEAFLGSWLRAREIQQDAIIVGSKWGYTYTANWQINLPDGEKHEVKEHSLTVLNRQYQESIAELDNYLDLYQIHSATLESGVLENQAVLTKLAELRDDGLLIGLSVSGSQQNEVITKALNIEFSGKLLFGSVQATWNLLEQSAAPALQAAHDAGLIVIVKEAVANGRLTSRNDSPQLAGLHNIARESRTTVDALAISTALNQPWSTIVLSGAARATQLHSNLAAANIDWHTTIMDAATDILEEPVDYWETRASLIWN